MHPSDEQPHAEITPHRPTKSDEGFTITTNISVSTPVRILRINGVMAMLGISRSTIYDWMDVNSKRYDATFPKSIKLGKSSVGWIESQLIEWVQSRLSA